MIQTKSPYVVTKASNFSKMHESIEGIVLRCTEFQERSRILTLFTPQGLLSLIIKGISRKKPESLALSSLFCCAEWHFMRGRGEIAKMVDGSVLHDFYSLKGSYSNVQAMGQLAQAVLASQAPEKSSPLLYSQFKSYLARACTSANPETLSASFYLKTLKYEGLLALQRKCHHCHQDNASALHEGESYCTASAPPYAVHFRKEEWEQLLGLAEARSFSELESFSLPEGLSLTVENYFKGIFKG